MQGHDVCGGDVVHGGGGGGGFHSVLIHTSSYNGSLPRRCQVFNFQASINFKNSTTDPEEFPALLDHVCQAVSRSQVLVQVPLVWLSQCLFPVHHPLTSERGQKQADTSRLETASIMKS